MCDARPGTLHQKSSLAGRPACPRLWEDESESETGTSTLVNGAVSSKHRKKKRKVWIVEGILAVRDKQRANACVGPCSSSTLWLLRETPSRLDCRARKQRGDATKKHSSPWEPRTWEQTGKPGGHHICRKTTTWAGSTEYFSFVTRCDGPTILDSCDEPQNRGLRLRGSAMAAGKRHYLVTADDIKRAEQRGGVSSSIMQRFRMHECGSISRSLTTNGGWWWCVVVDVTGGGTIRKTSCR